MRGVDEPDMARGLDIGDGDILPFRCCGDLECRRGLPMGETGHDMFLGIWISLEIRKVKSDKKLIIIIIIIVFGGGRVVLYHDHHHYYMCVCVCVCERERERERDLT